LSQTLGDQVAIEVHDEQRCVACVAHNEFASRGILRVASFNNKQKLGVINAGGVTAITSGVDAGRFAITDIDDSEVVVFDTNYVLL